MRRKTAVASCLAILLLGAGMVQSAAAPAIGGLLEQTLAGTHRDPANRARDRYRHPKETLEFMGLRPDMTVVEIWPAAGWYTEILAPIVREAGNYYGAIFVLGPDSPEYQRKTQQGFLDKLKGNPDLYGHVKLTEMGAGLMDIAPAGSADLVLTFRNVHNWMKGGFVQDAFKAFYTTLKPGGALGIVEHRAKPGTPIERMIDSGYVTEEQVMAYAQEAGFTLEEKSEINANPADSTNHPRGVWSLPPGFALCRELKPGPEADACRTPWQAIGESDRMTLRFRKPAK